MSAFRGRTREQWLITIGFGLLYLALGIWLGSR